MADTCAFCRHEEREKIEQEIVGGMSMREAARRYGLHRTQVRRHMNSHYQLAFAPQPPKFHRVGDEIERVASEIDAVDKQQPSALEKTRELHARVDRVMEYAERLGNSQEILRAASELRRIIELEAKLTGEAEQPSEKRELVVHLRKDFELPADDPRAWDVVRHTYVPRSEAALAAGGDTVDAEYEEVDRVVQ